MSLVELAKDTLLGIFLFAVVAGAAYLKARQYTDPSESELVEADLKAQRDAAWTHNSVMQPVPPDPVSEISDPDVTAKA